MVGMVLMVVYENTNLIVIQEHAEPGEAGMKHGHS